MSRVIKGAITLWKSRRFRRYADLMALALILWFCAATILDVIGWSADVEEGVTFDAIVVAGCRVMPDGEPSYSLRSRTLRAVTLWQRGLAPTIIFTGGIGDNPPSEARAAADLAAAQGVPQSAIILEDQSTSTEENAHLAARLLERRRVIVVTDTFHVFRAERVFARHFAHVTAVGSVTHLGSRLRGSLREVAALGYYLVTGRL